MTKDKKKTCFVVTPIGDDSSDIRRHIDGIIDQAIIPAIGEKYDIKVAHREFEIGSINDRVVKSVYESDLVIANLTGTNPNVMYELAVRYSFGKPVIVIAEMGTKLPFDVIDENTAFYINDPAGAAELRKKIIEFEKKIDINKSNYGPIHKVIQKIPLINDVESGKSVTNEQQMEYIISRLDSLEKNLGTLPINIPTKKPNVFRYKLQFNSENSIESIEEITDKILAMILDHNGDCHRINTSRDSQFVQYIIFEMPSSNLDNFTNEIGCYLFSVGILDYKIHKLIQLK